MGRESKTTHLTGFLSLGFRVFGVVSPPAWFRVYRGLGFFGVLQGTLERVYNTC